MPRRLTILTLKHLKLDVEAGENQWELDFADAPGSHPQDIASSTLTASATFRTNCSSQKDGIYVKVERMQIALTSP